MLKQSYLTKKVKYIPSILENDYKKALREKEDNYLLTYSFYELEMITRLNEKLKNYHNFEHGVVQKCLADFNKILLKLKDLEYLISENQHDKETFHFNFELFAMNGNTRVADRLKVFNNRRKELCKLKESYHNDEYLTYLKLYYIWFKDILETVKLIYPPENSEFFPEFKLVLLKVSRRITKKNPYVEWSNWDKFSIKNHPLVVLIDTSAMKVNEINYSYNDYRVIYTNKILHDIAYHGNIIVTNWFFIMLKKAKSEVVLTTNQMIIYYDKFLTRYIISYLVGDNLIDYFFPRQLNIISLKEVKQLLMNELN